MQKKKVKIIGAGFAGLSAASSLASKGFDVEVFEKNFKSGGRATQMEEQGFLFDLFESLEPGSANKLKKFLEEAAYKYEVGMKEFVFKPSLSITDFFDLRILKSIFRLGMFQTVHSYA